MRFLAIAGAVIGLDQLTKALVLRYLGAHGGLRLIGDFLMLTVGKNTGAAFSFLPGHPRLFVVIAIVASAVMAYYYYRTPWQERLAKVGLALAFAGAVGNLIDRVRFGYVVDFIAVSVWPVFNVADSAIVVGVGLIILNLWVGERSQ